MGEGFDDLGSHLRQMLAEGGAGRGCRPQGQRIDEKSDHGFGFDLRASGHRRPDDEILLLRPAQEEHLDERQQSHEQCGLPALDQLLEGARQFHRQPDRRLHQSLRALVGQPARPVIGEGQRFRSPRQVLSPVGEVVRHRRTGQPLALPHGEVRVLDGEFGQPGRAPFDESPVQRRDLSQERAHRPAVGDDVMLREEEQSRLRTEPEHTRLEERAPPKVETVVGGLLREPLRLAFLLVTG